MLRRQTTPLVAASWISVTPSVVVLSSQVALAGPLGPAPSGQSAFFVHSALGASVHLPYVWQSESAVQVVATSRLQWPVLPAHCVAWFASVQACVLGG